jgi:hypothetical protein
MCISSARLTTHQAQSRASPCKLLVTPPLFVCCLGRLEFSGTRIKKPVKDMNKVELVSEISRLNDELRAAKNAKRFAKKTRDKALAGIQAAAKRFALTNIPDSEIRGIARRLFGSIACGDSEMVCRIMGSYNCVGICRLCKINLYSERSTPARKAMPCGVAGCPFEKWRQAGVVV